MDTSSHNPFDLIRASDFSDAQIQEYWVDFSGENPLISLIEPTAKTSKHILGGKGSGKTHLMRMCSFPVQKLRYRGSTLEGVRRDGYLGIFMRGNVIDTGRFAHKGQSQDKWGPLFNYYFELRLVEALLGALNELAVDEPAIRAPLDAAAIDATDLFDVPPDVAITSIKSLLDTVVGMRKDTDYAVNNSAFTRKLDIPIRLSPGALLFGIPELASQRVPVLSRVQVLYLVDEVENLSEEQQRFLNSLVRHRRGPCSFRIGARLYGIKTLANYGSDEENKEGSEFKKIYLDQVMRSNKRYADFARRLCAKRLVDSGFLDTKARLSDLAKRLDSYFATPVHDRYYQTVSVALVGSEPSSERRYFRLLRQQLEEGRKSGTAVGVTDDVAASVTIAALFVPDFPLLEKLNIFLLYKAWFRRENLFTAARAIQKECQRYQASQNGKGKYATAYGHFSLDLLAQMHREYKAPCLPIYCGFDAFAQMSAGVPRNVLVILRNIYKWALFNGERPFREATISTGTQWEAILESSIFFYEEDARPGKDVPDVRNAVDRLAELLREARFSSKPVESSPLAFSLNRTQLTRRAVQNLMMAENWSYVVEIPKGRPNKNTKHVDLKFQLNPMLSPKWDLPISRRGDVALPAQLANTIFDNEMAQTFQSELERFAAGMKAPRFGLKRQRNDRHSLELDLGDG